MDPQDKQMVARKLRRQADAQRDIAHNMLAEGLPGGLFMTRADVTYEVSMGIYGALNTIARDFEERL